MENLPTVFPVRSDTVAATGSGCILGSAISKDDGLVTFCRHRGDLWQGSFRVSPAGRSPVYWERCYSWAKKEAIVAIFSIFSTRLRRTNPSVQVVLPDRSRTKRHRTTLAGRALALRLSLRQARWLVFLHGNLGRRKQLRAAPLRFGCRGPKSRRQVEFHTQIAWRPPVAAFDRHPIRDVTSRNPELPGQGVSLPAKERRELDTTAPTSEGYGLHPQIL